MGRLACQTISTRSMSKPFTTQNYCEIILSNCWYAAEIEVFSTGGFDYLGGGRQDMKSPLTAALATEARSTDSFVNDAVFPDREHSMRNRHMVKPIDPSMPTARRWLFCMPLGMFASPALQDAHVKLNMPRGFPIMSPAATPSGTAKDSEP
mmetsp:Transcript_51772/g.144664  ORF Transcript_51772/g.144664 Transcript_51772/m.144664 type:complete len:151 (-) Transcript_51772:38-490(-)